MSVDPSVFRSAKVSTIHIWRAANLMLRAYGEMAIEESSVHADDLRCRTITLARQYSTASLDAVS
jgi:hypothetical protein